MRYVAAYLLATLGGNKSPSKADLEKILESVGLEVDSDRLDKVVSELNGKDINTVIAEGMGKLASIPSGGVVASGASGGAGKGDDTAPAEEKKEEKKEESEEESDDDMGFGLFD